MKKGIKDFLSASAILMGTVVGVGIFGLPYVFSKAGFFVGLGFLIFLGGAMLLVHLLYGEVVLRTRRKKRLVGYAQKYLGPKGKLIATFSALFGLFSAQLAYLIVGGNFLSLALGNILGRGQFIYVLIFFLLGSFVIFKGSRLIAMVEFLMSIFLIGVILLIFLTSLPHIHLENFGSIYPRNIFLPYGVILFSLTGASAIPEAIDYLRAKKRKTYKTSLILGSLLPVLLSLLFVMAVLGVAGKETSEAALESLMGRLPGAVIYTGLLFGILAVFTSFITIGITLVKIFWYDYRIPKVFSQTIVAIIPLVAFLLGLKNFIEIIGIAGTIMGGIDGALIILIYRKARKEGDQKPFYQLKISSLLLNLLIFVFVLGIVYQITYLFRK